MPQNTDWSQFQPVKKDVDWSQFKPAPSTDVDWSGFKPATYSPQEAQAKIAEIRAGDKPVEQPWIDPIDAITGPAGFARKAGIKATAKAIPWSIAAEPIVGGAQEYADKAMGGAPGYVKAPVQLATGLATGGLLTSGARKTRRGADVIRDAVKGAPEQPAKSKFVRGMFEEQFKPKKSEFENPLRDTSFDMVDPGIMAKSQGEGLRLYSNPVNKVWEDLSGSYQKYIGTPLWDKLVVEKLPQLIEKVPGGRTLNKALIYGHRGTDFVGSGDFNRSLEQMRTNQSLGAEYGVDLGNRLMKLPEQDQLKISSYITGGPDAQIDPRLSDVADEAKDALYHLGKQAVDVGLLKEETFFKNVGRYMPRLYASKEYDSLLNKWNVSAPDRMDLTRFKKRKDIPKEVREQMGEILTPGYPVAKGIAQLTHDIEQAKWFKGVADNPNWALKESDDVNIPDGWQKVENEKLGPLKGHYVHPEIHDELKFMTRETNENWRKAYGMWKYGKVILSPKTHMRNVMSNSILAHMGGMPVTSQPKWLAKAASELSKGGDAWQLAKQTGLLQSTFVNKELRNLFDDVGSQLSGMKADSFADNLGILGKTFSKVKGGGRGAAKLYELSEQWFKLAKFMHNMDKGMAAKRAAEDAEKWLFNYGKLTRFQEKYRSSLWGAPFATFTFKALPRFAEAAVKTPWRFLGPAAAIYGIEQAASNVIGDTPEQEEAKKKLRPDWQQGGITKYLPNFARFPIVDDAGREYYLNLSYILPWGDLGEQGGFMGIPGSLMPGSNPLAKEFMSQAMNYDPFFESPIVRDEDIAGKSGLDKRLTSAKSRARHAYNTFAPTLALDVEKGVQAARGAPGPFGGYYDYRGRAKDPRSVFLDTALGIKTYPVSYEDQLVRAVNEKSPDKGILGRKIQNDMRRLAVQMNAAKKDGKDTSWYKEQLQEKRSQLIGLAKEVGVIAETYKKATGDTQ